MAKISFLTLASSVAALRIEDAHDQMDTDDDTSDCVKMTAACNATGTPLDTGAPCCEVLGNNFGAPGELGMKFPKADLLLSYFVLPPCSAFQFHYHNHAEALIMIQGKLVNPFVNANQLPEVYQQNPNQVGIGMGLVQQPVLAGQQMELVSGRGQSQVLPEGGGHSYVCTETDTKDGAGCRWLSLWPNNDFYTKFLFPPQGEGQSSMTPRADPAPIIPGKIQGDKCNLDPMSTIGDAAIDKRESSCFQAGKSKKPQVPYEAKMIYDFEKMDKNGIKMEKDCVYGVVNGKARWVQLKVHGDNQSSVLTKNTFATAGDNPRGNWLRPIPECEDTIIYSACRTRCELENKSILAYGTYNLNPDTQNASEEPILDAVVENLCRNKPLAIGLPRLPKPMHVTRVI